MSPRASDDEVLGGVGNGWKVALTTLMNERSGIGFSVQVRLRQLFDRVLQLRPSEGCSMTRPWPSAWASCTHGSRSFALRRSGA